MRILIADDHPLYREAARIQIERSYPEAATLEASTFDDVLSFFAQEGSTFDLVLVDYRMPGMSLEALAGLISRFPDIPIAVISGIATASQVREAVAAGARGFLPKTATGPIFTRAIELLLSGGTTIPTEILGEDQIVDGEIVVSWISKLTPKEMEVLRFTARGMSNKEIGRELKLAEVTVKLHLRSVFRKIGARSRAEAAVIATKAGIRA